MLSVRNLTKTYSLGKKKSGKKVVALDNVSIDFPDKGLVFLLGKSGSGKSTLLNTIGGLDTFDSGEIIIKGKSSKDFKQSDFDSYRNTFIGFIFQEYNILNEFTVGKNLSLALELQGKNATKEEVDKLLDQVDLSGYYKRKPNQLSGGQKQRIAIARALIKDPEIIMADEPTGALDSTTGKQVMDTLKKLSKQKLVIVVSHDREFAHEYGDRVIELKDGKIISDETKKEVLSAKSSSGVSYIGNEIIHIKKGSKFTLEDLRKINELIKNNTKDGETIISFDQKSNDEIKQSAFITDEGNREIFVKTEKEDIHQSSYDPKNFKLIKSRLRFKDSFKMGASSLKHKPIRLIFTILLSCVAFCMFGITDTMASFNRASSVNESLKLLNVNTLAITKTITSDYGYDSVDIMGSEYVNKLASKFPNKKFYKVVGAEGNYINISSSDFHESASMYSLSSLKTNLVSGVMEINTDVMQNLHLTCVLGRLPKADDEMCISKNLYDFFVSNEVELTFSEGSFKQASFNNGYGSSLPIYNQKIVGVIKDETDISRYKDLKLESNDMSTYVKQQEMATVAKYGTLNMCYVNQNQFNKLMRTNHGGGNPYFYYKNNMFAYLSNFYTYESFTEFLTKNTYSNINYEMLSGHSINNLRDNQIVISKQLAQRLNIDYKTDPKITINNWNNIGKEYEIVGVYYFDSDYIDEYVITSAECINSFLGSTYVVARYNPQTDKDLVNYIETYKEGNVGFCIQFASTSTLNSFEGTINAMTKPLLYVGIGLAVFSGLMLMNFISTSIVYKKREIGILRAIGARGKDVFAIFFSEAFVICIINFILSAIGCGIACYFINRAILNDLGFTVTLLVFGIRQVLLLLGVSVLVAFVSSFLPVYRIAKKNPIDSINNR